MKKTNSKGGGGSDAAKIVKISSAEKRNVS